MGWRIDEWIEAHLYVDHSEAEAAIVLGKTITQVRDRALALGLVRQPNKDDFDVARNVRKATLADWKPSISHEEHQRRLAEAEGS